MSERRCSVRLRRRYAAAPAEVWAVLTEPESLERWLASPRQLDLSPGGSFELELQGESVNGRVREVEPQRVLELDWRLPGEEPSIVRFELSADGGGTLLVLDHRLIEEPLGMAYLGRWTRDLDRLERDLLRRVR